MTGEDIEKFAAVTGDKNPVHLDEEYAKASFFGRRIAHGMLTAGLISSLLGNVLPGPGTIYLRQELKFLAPVYPGDTIEAGVEVLEKNDAKKTLRLKTSCCNQEGKAVLEGEAYVMLPG
ncbi:MAG: MaoC family dehydratase [Desulfotomaculales bacterium]